LRFVQLRDRVDTTFRKLRGIDWSDGASGEKGLDHEAESISIGRPGAIDRATHPSIATSRTGTPDAPRALPAIAALS
jgi:hypothetical protein